MKLGDRLRRYWLPALCALTVLVPAFDVFAPPKQPPSITTQPQSLVVITGGAASFSVAATGSTPLSYQWRKNGAAIAGATTTRYSLATVRTNDAAGYDVVVSNPYGTATSAAATLTVYVPPWFAVQPTNLTVSVGGKATFTVSAQGIPAPGLQWYFGTTAIAGATSPTLSLANVEDDQAGAYYCVASNAAGEATSAVAELTVLMAPVIDVQPASLTVIAGDNVSFSVTASGAEPLSYRWLFNGNALSEGGQFSGVNGATLSLSNAQPANAGSYAVVVTNALGSVTSGVAALTVLVPPAISAQPQSRTNNVGSDATFRVTASGAAPLAYQWQFNGVAIPGATDSALVRSAVSFADAGGYRVVVTNADGAVTSTVAMLTVVCPAATLNPPTVPGGTAGEAYSQSLVVSGGAAPYTYVVMSGALPAGLTLSTGGVLSGTLLAVGSFNFGIRATDTNGCGATNVYTLVVGCPTVTVSPVTLPDGVVGVGYSQRLTASGGFGPYSYAVTGGSLPAGLVLTSAGVLNGVPTAVGTNSFTVTATDTNGCSGNRGLTVAVNVSTTPLTVTAQPASLMVLAGANVSFAVSVLGAEPLSYQWRFNGVNLADGGHYGGATAATLVVSNVQPADAGSYAVVITNVAGSVTSAWATLVVIPPAACVPAAAGLVGWWPGDGDASDIVGGHTGTLQGGATADAPGVVGTAFSFDGTNGYVQIPDDSALHPAQLTIEAWVRFDSLDSPAWGGSPAGDQYLVFKQNANSSNFEGFALTKTRVGGHDFFDFQVSSGSSQSAEVKSVSTVVTGVWYHVAAVRGANSLQLYVNGQLESQGNVNFAQNYGTRPLYLGSSGQPTWDHRLAGALDEVSLYNRALSASQIAAIHAAGAAGKCKALSVTTQPQSRSVLIGSDVSLGVAAVGSAPLVYQWQRDGVTLTDGGNISGAFLPTLTLANVTFADTASYRVIVTNTVSAVTSAVAVLTVVPALFPPAINDQPDSQTTTVGTSINFSVGVSGTAPIGYQWRFNGTNLANGGRFSGATSSTLVISTVLPVDAGDYSVVVTNELQALTSTVATLTVTVPIECVMPPAGLVGWWPGDGSGQDIAGTNNGTLEGGATADVPAVVGTGFSLDGTNKYIQVPDSPALKPDELTVECWVKWHNLDTPGTSVYPGQQYIVFKQNSRATDFEAYVLSKDRTWNDIILWEVTSASGQLVRIDSTSPVTTNVWYHLAAVRGSNYIQLYFNGELEAEAAVNFPQDYGDWPLYFGTSGQSYYDRRLNGVIDEVALYNRALSAQEIAILFASGAAGKCKGTNGIVITAQPQSQAVAPGSNVVFSVSATGVEPMTYQWEFNGNLISGATNSILALTGVQASNAGGYRVVIGNPTGTKTSAEAILAVAGAPLLVNSRTTGEGLFAFTLSGTAGLTYLIEVTTNLEQWAFLASLTNTTGQTDFVDTTSSGSRLRFYRARLAD